MTEEERVAHDDGRRRFMVRMLFAFGAVVGGLISVPVVGAFFEPLLRGKPQAWRPVGKIDAFTVGDTVLVKFRDASPLPWSGETDRTASWLRRVSENEFIAFSVNCAHLGCPVRWIADAELFLCPCHGGVYNKDGSYAAGPPPHGLDQYPVRLRNGQVEIRTSPIPITNI